MIDVRGVRRPDGTLPHELAAGEYALAAGGKALWLCSPDGVPGHVEVPSWRIEFHEDGTVTVDPSIWWDRPTGWHGWLRRGVWEEA